ncbi:uncharacterized protein [Ptychodera flava]|uniref:uncharacterized protein n=1 Tax=Ptychodera flava TaxID=63121 RepID=UPI00396A163A
MAYVQSRNLVAALIRNGTTNTCPKAVCRLSTSKLVNCDLRLSTIMASVHFRNMAAALIRPSIRCRRRNAAHVRGLSSTVGVNRDTRSNNLDLKYESLSEHHIAEAARLITENVSKNVPAIHHLRIPEEIYLQRNIAVLEKVRQSGIGAVAIDNTSNKILSVGTAFWVSNLDEFEYLLDPTMCEEFKPMRILLFKLAELFFNVEEVRNFQAHGQQFISLDICVAMEVNRRTGIMTHFGNMALEVAKSKGVRVAFGRANNKQVLMFLKNLGFEVLAEILYCDFEIEGFKPFKDMTGDPQFEGSKILIRRL